MTAINKGQLLGLIGGFSIVISIYRMPAPDITKFLMESLNFLKSHAAVGYILFFITFIYTISHVKNIKVVHKKELDKVHSAMEELRKRLN